MMDISLSNDMIFGLATAASGCCLLSFAAVCCWRDSVRRSRWVDEKDSKGLVAQMPGAQVSTPRNTDVQLIQSQFVPVRRLDPCAQTRRPGNNPQQKYSKVLSLAADLDSDQIARAYGSLSGSSDNLSRESTPRQPRRGKDEQIASAKRGGGKSQGIDISDTAPVRGKSGGYNDVSAWKKDPLRSAALGKQSRDMVQDIRKSVDMHESKPSVARPTGKQMQKSVVKADERKSWEAKESAQQVPAPQKYGASVAIPAQTHPSDREHADHKRHNQNTDASVQKPSKLPEQTTAASDDDNESDSHSEDESSDDDSQARMPNAHQALCPAANFDLQSGKVGKLQDGGDLLDQIELGAPKPCNQNQEQEPAKGQTINKFDALDAELAIEIEVGRAVSCVLNSKAFPQTHAGLPRNMGHKSGRAASSTKPPKKKKAKESKRKKSP